MDILIKASFITLALTLNAFAAEKKICLITSDIDAEKTEFYIDVNSQGELDSIRLYKTLGSKVLSDEFHPIERAIVDGVVASERDGREVVLLKAENFILSQGGTINLRYLQNGVTGSYKIFKLKLGKVGGNFVLTSNNQTINKIHFLANRAPLINKVIGIKEVKVSYSPKI